MAAHILQPEEISIGIICPLPIEVAAMIQMLDERYSTRRFPRDPNLYHLGRIGAHNIVIAGLPDGLAGIASATTVAERLWVTFSSVKALLLVGIGGGVATTKNDMRLGDVVVSRPDGKYGGVLQYDFGKSLSEGRFEHTSALNSPPREVLSTLAAMKANHLVNSTRRPDYLIYLEASQSNSYLKYPGTENDILFEASYDHTGGSDCTSCDKAKEIKRKPRKANEPAIHYGTIASANQLMRDSKKRDSYNQDYDGRILCFEMEAAGLMNSTPCLVIRGISDYADSHKREDHAWHGYAAAVAAAFAKEFINTIPGSELKSMLAVALLQIEGSTVGCSELHRVAYEGDIVNLRRLLQNHSVDVNRKDDDGMTSLHRAAMAGHEAIVRILLGSEAKIESEDYAGRTALHYAAAEGHKEVVRELLRRGANIEADNDGKTPLHFAVENDHVEVVIRLLLQNSSNSQSKGAKVAAVSALQGTDEAIAWWIKYGPELGAVDCNGDTMLHWAASKGQITVVQVLLEKGIDIEAKNPHLDTALHLAANAGHEAAARLLLDNGADIEAKQKLQLTPLFCAVSQGHEEVAQLLIERGANTVSTVYGITALHTASEGGFTRLVRLLVHSGVNVNAQNANGATALSFAAKWGDVEMVRLLLVNKANIKIRSKGGVPVLDIAAAAGNVALVQLLLQETDVDVHARANDGRHALITAASKGHEAIVRLLLQQRGTDVNVKTNTGMTALQISAQEGHIDVVRLLVAEKSIDIDTRTEDGRTPLFFAASKNSVAVTQLLLARGANIMAKNRKGTTALCEAAAGGHEAVVRLLLEKGASPKEINPSKETPLHFAAMSGSEAVVRLLIEKGASVKAQAGNGTTVLHWAASKGNVSIIKLLIQSGASIKQRNAKGGRPVDVAKLKGHEEAMRLLRC